MREIGSEFHIDPGNGDTDLIGLLTRCAQDMGSGVRFLRCGRDSLGFIADDITRRRRDLAGADRIIYMPALCCDSMVLPFTKRDYAVRYFRLRDDLSIDTGHLYSIVSDAGLADPVILVMNYYGISDTAGAKKHIRERFPGAVIIEDVTHRVLSPERFTTEDEPADYYIGSIRKWMGTPDGAFVIGPQDMADIPEAPDSSFTRLRLQALREKADYISSADRPQDMKDHFRSLLSDAEDSLEDGIIPAPVSESARGLLGHMDLKTMRDRRRENYSVLKECLLSDDLAGVMYEIAGADEDMPDCPFMLPVIMRIRAIREGARIPAGQSITRDRFENKLAARGVYAPVLWPVDARAAEVCEVSRRFSQNMLAFYIDQRYDADDMRYVAEVFGDELRAILG